MKTPLPEAYQKGFVDFLGCRIELPERVFIPRMETEYWAKKAFSEISDSFSHPLNVLDIFAGSGCLGIAFIFNYLNLCRKADFVDVSLKAVRQIKSNLKINHIPADKYRIIKSDIFKGLKNEESYDIIFANPPYVAKERLLEIEKSTLEYEPKQALFSGEKGIGHIKRFLGKAPSFLKKPGVIYLEFDPLQKENIYDLISSNNYSSFDLRKDQFNKYRWAKILK